MATPTCGETQTFVFVRSRDKDAGCFARHREEAALTLLWGGRKKRESFDDVFFFVPFLKATACPAETCVSGELQTLLHLLPPFFITLFLWPALIYGHN